MCIVVKLIHLQFKKKKTYLGIKSFTMYIKNYYLFILSFCFFSCQDSHSKINLRKEHLQKN